VDRIHAHIDRKLIAIIAPPGFGKSILLGDFNAHTDFATSWVRLGPADRDPMRLATVLAASLQKRFRRLRGQPSLDSLAGSPPEAVARTFIKVIEERIREPFVVILDDVHLLNSSPASLALLNTLLLEGPDRMTVVAAGRELPDVSMAKLVVDGEMAGIGQQDLELTRDELIAVIERQMGVVLEEGDADHIMEETKGWITGALLLVNPENADPTSLIKRGKPIVYEYLASVTLNDQPSELREFMLDSSVLPVMTAEDCNHVLDRRDCQHSLRRLVREGLFITATDQSPRTYEYHPLFREFLLATFAEDDPTRLKELRVAAAGRLADRSSIEDAVDLYFQADEFKHAALVVAKHVPALFEKGRIGTLEGWASRFLETCYPVQELLLYLSVAYTDRGILDKAETFLERALESLAEPKSPTEEGLLARAETVKGLIALQRGRYSEVLQIAESVEKNIPRPGNVLRKVSCLRLKARSIHGIGRDYIEAERHAQEAVSLIESTDDAYTFAMALLDLSTIQDAMGKLMEAQATSLRAHELLVKIEAPLALAISFNNLAFYAHLEGNYTDALDLFAEGLLYAHQAASLRYETTILFGQADLFCDMGLVFQASELYGQGLRLAMRLDNENLIRYGYTQISAMHRRCRTEKLAKEWLDRASAVGNGNGKHLGVAIQRASLDLSKSPADTQRNLHLLLRKSNGDMRAHERTLLMYFMAKAAFSEGNLQAAHNILSEGFDWAGGHGTEQFIAGEMMYDDAICEFAFNQLDLHPVMTVIQNRIELMKVVARRYKETETERSETAILKLNALGRSEVLLNNEPLPDLEPLPRQILLFVADRQTVGRDVMLECFWPDSSLGRQTASLYTATYNLRQALGSDPIVIEGAIYRLNPAIVVEFDVREFEQAVNLAENMPPGDPRKYFALTETLNAYGGDFLPEYTFDWVLERRRSLEMRYLQVLSLHADEALVSGRPNEAADSLHKALELDPLNDDLVLRYLRLLGGLGRRSEIVALYQRYVRRLAEELGLDPPSSVRELYTQLIA
jgi:ATP/maltotriose-dependent transcriptional regulator MalT/two-component SAPR family response regulator